MAAGPRPDTVPEPSHLPEMVRMHAHAGSATFGNASLQASRRWVQLSSQKFGQPRSCPDG